MNPHSDSPAFGVWRALGPRALLLTLAACFAAYSPVLTSYFLADDFRLFGWSPSQGLGHILQTHGRYMRPLPGWTMHLEYRLWGLNPLPPHLFNLALHAIVSVQISALALRISGGWSGRRVFAWSAGLLFALHPIHTGAVSWLAARYDLFLAAFGLGSVLKLDDFLRTQSRLALAASVLLLVGALLSKETAVALPGVLILWALLRRERSEPLPWTISGLMVAVLLGYFALRIAALGEMSPGARIRPSLAGLPYNLFVLPLQRLIIPADNTLWAMAWTPLVSVLAALMVVTLIAGILGLRAQTRSGNSSDLTGPQALKILAFGFGMHQMCIFAMVSVVDRLTAPVMPSRLLYLPSAGFCLLLAAGLGSMGARAQRVLLGAWLVVYGSITIGNNMAWRAAGQITHAAITQVESIVGESEIERPTLLVTGLPETIHDAYVFLPSSLRNALKLHLPGAHKLQRVGTRPADSQKDLRTQMPLRRMLALRWNETDSEFVNQTGQLKAAIQKYMKLPGNPNTWTGERLQAWTTKSEGFVASKGGMRGTATSKYLALHSPEIPLNSSVIEVRLDLRPATGTPTDGVEKKPRLFAEWTSKGNQSSARTQRIGLEPGKRQTVRIQCPPALVVEDLQREGLKLELLFAIQNHEIHIHQIRAKKLPRAGKTPRKQRRSPRPAPPPQSDAPRSPQSAHDR